MVGDFAQRWQRSGRFKPSATIPPPRGEPTGENRAKASGQIKQKLQDASRLIQAQTLRLDQALARLRERDAAIFERIVSAVQNNENARAVMLSNEVSEVRRMRAVVLQAKLALEQLLLRLSTIQELGDVVATLAPAAEVIRSIRPGLESLVPEAESEIGSVSDLLSDILIDVSSRTGDAQTPLFEGPNSEEVDKVIAEAELVAERRLGAMFPELISETSNPGVESSEEEEGDEEAGEELT